ncbi:MAG: flavodoxin [Oscillospiraceae bacterium]|nr:flavodoxin [Oscillospiraceae bacterium]
MEKPSLAVRYFSKSGNTKKLADAIAESVGCKAEPIPASPEGYVDILFLGASVYWGGSSAEVKKYIQSLDSSTICKVVVFSTSALAERAFPQIEKCLRSSGIEADKQNFYCRGEFAALHKGRPNKDDLDAARKFAVKMAEGK